MNFAKLPELLRTALPQPSPLVHSAADRLPRPPATMLKTLLAVRAPRRQSLTSRGSGGKR